jgi:AraC-like DNA-binding protein
MSPEFLSGNLRHGEALTEAAIGILINALGVESVVVEPSTLRDIQLLRVRKYIDANLDDPELSPGMIAAANGISVRYLHCLFEPEGTTMVQYVIKKRLVRCRRDLLNPVMAHRTITDIAFSWGFQNSTHFSRRFKDEFGLSPQEFRNDACSTTRDGTRAADHYRSAIMAAGDGAEIISIQ